eukprot:2822638-Karenia_brevis.AAC.1
MLWERQEEASLNEFISEHLAVNAVGGIDTIRMLMKPRRLSAMAAPENQWPKLRGPGASREDECATENS